MSFEEYMEKKRIACPAENMGQPCKRWARTSDGLFYHLYEHHRKADLCKVILQLLSQLAAKERRR